MNPSFFKVRLCWSYYGPDHAQKIHLSIFVDSVMPEQSRALSMYILQLFLFSYRARSKASPSHKQCWFFTASSVKCLFKYIKNAIFRDCITLVPGSQKLKCCDLDAISQTLTDFGYLGVAFFSPAKLFVNCWFVCFSVSLSASQQGLLMEEDAPSFLLFSFLGLVL